MGIELSTSPVKEAAVADPQKRAVRFKSELLPRHGSWLAVLLVYALGAVVLLALVQLVGSVRELNELRGRSAAFARNLAAVERLVDHLDHPASREDIAAAMTWFAGQHGEAGRNSRDIATLPRADTATPASAADLVAAEREGASPARLRELAGWLAARDRSRAKAAERRVAAAEAKVDLRIALLGVVVTLGVFGGGMIFLIWARRLERLLATHAQELDEVDASRRLFFAKASHELRTPVTAMLGEAEVALAVDGERKQMREALMHIAAHATFLGHRIEEMIGLAKASDGKLHLDREKLDMREVVAAAVEDARSFAASVEVALDVTLPDAPVPVVGDPLWLKRALLAVIENALKFSPMEGRIGIDLASREALAEVTVTDEGTGMVPAELPRVFDAYYQTHAGKARGGTGLGLAMTRWVAEQHGGRAWARNVGSWRASGCAVTVAVRRERAA